MLIELIIMKVEILTAPYSKAFWLRRFLIGLNATVLIVSLAMIGSSLWGLTLLNFSAVQTTIFIDLAFITAILATINSIAGVENAMVPGMHLMFSVTLVFLAALSVALFIGLDIRFSYIQNLSENGIRFWEEGNRASDKAIEFFQVFAADFLALYEGICVGGDCVQTNCSAAEQQIVAFTPVICQDVSVLSQITYWVKKDNQVTPDYLEACFDYITSRPWYRPSSSNSFNSSPGAAAQWCYIRERYILEAGSAYLLNITILGILMGLLILVSVIHHLYMFWVTQRKIKTV